MQPQTILSLLLAGAASRVAGQQKLPQADYKGYITEANCPASSRFYVASTDTVGFCTQVESGWPIVSVKVSQINPCLVAGQQLLVDVSAERCNNFTTVRTFAADGSCTNVADLAPIQALTARCA